MIDFENFQRVLRANLNHLYDPDYLRKSQLAVWLNVTGRYNTPTALRNILVDEIEALRPADSAAHGGHDQQVYDILLFRYIQQSDPDEVAHQLGVSARQLRRLQANALETLAYHLWKKFKMEEKLNGAEKNSDETGSVDLLSADDALSSGGRNDFDWLKTTPVLKPLEIQEELKKVLALVHPMMTQYQVSLHLALPEDLPQVAVHPVAFRQALLGIFGEMFKRAVGEKIQIEAAGAPGKVTFRIACRVNAPDPSLTLQAKGIQDTCRIVELCNGKLDFHYTGDVTSFEFFFPVMPLYSVLVVDDNQDLIDLIARYVDGTRYHVIGLRESQQTIVTALRENVQIIVLDVMMSDDDGWEVLGRLRSHPQTKDIPIVICTILSQEELAHLLGAAAFIQKPVHRETLLEVLNTLTSKLGPEST